MIQFKHLFNLIQSMDKAEKRTFTLLCKMQSGSKKLKFVQLFDLIDGFEEYEEERITKRAFRIAKSENSLSQLKLSLYEKVLQALRYHAENEKEEHVQLQIKQHLTDAHVLHKKGFLDQARDSLKRVKKMAKEYGLLGYYTEALNFEKQIIEEKIDVAFLNNHLEELYKEEQEIIKQQQNLSQFWYENSNSLEEN